MESTVDVAADTDTGENRHGMAGAATPYTDVIHMMRSPGINPPPPAQSPQADANGMNGEGEYFAGIWSTVAEIT